MWFIGKLSRDKRGAGSIIGAVFIVLIIMSGFAFYTLNVSINDDYRAVLQTMDQLDLQRKQENIEFTSVSTTTGNKLNITVKNTGSYQAHLIWLGIFNETVTPTTQEYHELDIYVDPAETQPNIPEETITLREGQQHVIQLVTELGNTFSYNYPQSEEYTYDFVDQTCDLYSPSAKGTHSLFSAQQAGPDGICDTLTEEKTDESGYIVQQGRTLITTTQQDIAITEVNSLNRAFVIFNHYYSCGQLDQTPASTGNTDPNWGLVSAYLVNTTHIRVNRNSATSNVYIDWQVIEALNEEFEVFRGSYDWDASSGTSFSTNIGATVTPANCLAWVSGTITSQTSREAYDTTLFRAYVSSGTQITIQRTVADANTAGTLRWIVVEFDINKIDSIQTGTTTVTNTHTQSSPRQVTLSPSIDTSDSILLFQVGVADSGLDQCSVAGRIANENTIEFYTRGVNTQTRDIRYYVIDFGSDCGSKQSGTIDYSGNANWYDVDQTLSPTVTLSRTISFTSLTQDGGGTAFARPFPNAYVENSINYNIWRSRYGQEAYIDWQVLELPYSASARVWSNDTQPIALILETEPDISGSAATYQTYGLNNLASDDSTYGGGDIQNCGTVNDPQEVSLIMEFNYSGLAISGSDISYLTFEAEVYFIGGTGRAPTTDPWEMETTFYNGSVDIYNWDTSSWEIIGTVFINNPTDLSIWDNTGDTNPERPLIRHKDSGFSDAYMNSSGYIRIRIQMTGVFQGTLYDGCSVIDYVDVDLQYGEENYELDLEVQWTNADYDETNEWLCIYGGTMSGSEDILVDVWNGTAWINVFTNLSSGWNSVNVSSYLISPTFTIRFRSTSDTTQDSWKIDATFLYVWT